MHTESILVPNCMHSSRNNNDHLSLSRSLTLSLSLFLSLFISLVLAITLKRSILFSKTFMVILFWKLDRMRRWKMSVHSLWYPSLKVNIFNFQRKYFTQSSDLLILTRQWNVLAIRIAQSWGFVHTRPRSLHFQQKGTPFGKKRNNELVTS